MTDFNITLVEGQDRLILDVKAPAIISPPPPSNWSPVIEAGLGDAIIQGRFYRPPQGLLNCETPIHISVGTHSVTYAGMIGDGTVLRSTITTGDPVLTVDIPNPSVNVDRLIFEKFEIQGTGLEGDGFSLKRPTTGSWLYNHVLRDITVRSCKRGFVTDGNVFEAAFYNCHTIGNRDHGAWFGSTAGGIISTLRWHSGALRKNLGCGAFILSPSRGVSFHAADFIENEDYGLWTRNGCEGVNDCTFENNSNKVDWADLVNGVLVPRTRPRAGLVVENYLSSAIATRFLTNSRQDYGIWGRVTGEFRVGGGTWGTKTGGTINPKFARFDNFGGGTNAKLVLIGRHGGLPMEIAGDLAFVEVP